MSEPLRVLFVCTANICRSPFMELYSRSVLGDDVTVSSAGTHGLDTEPIAAEMAGELAERGVDSGGFRSRRLTAAMVVESELVLTAERLHRRFILDDHPEAFRRVLTVGQAVEAASRVAPEARGRDALPELSRLRGRADEHGDVVDPYGLGAGAAARAAGRITAMLDQLLPVLSPTYQARKTTHG